LPPYVNGNRAADIVDLLMGLIDSGTLTGVGVHTAADATNNIAVAPAATDLATAQTLLNAMRDGTGEAGGGMAAHFLIVGASEHIGADVTNVITAAAATDLATAAALANDLKAQHNGHLALNGATGHYGPELTNVVTLADVGAVLADVIALANDLRTKYNAHCANIDAGSVRSFIDNAAFTGVNSLIGATLTFAAATTTVALRGVSRVISSNGVNDVQFLTALPTAPAVGDTLTIEYTSVDDDIATMRGAKAMAEAHSNPYGPGPSFINLVAKLITLLGATAPTYMDTQAKIIAMAEAFGVGSPHAGAGSQGHGGGEIIVDMLTTVRNAVANYTAPA
jgi:hypothetical protein